MRSVKYFVASSFDGYISRLDGGVDWLFMDQDYGMSEFFSSVDVAVMGRRSYEKMREVAGWQALAPGMKYVVFSRSQPTGERNGVSFVSGDIQGWLSSIREQQGKDIWLVGGGEMVQEFLRERAVDEIGITIHPRLLAEGVPLFRTPYPETELALVRCRQYSTGLVQSFYKVKY